MTYTLHLGDCLEYMKTMPDKSVDAVITDPPFTFAGGISNGRASMADNQFFLYWWKDICAELNRALKPEGEGFVWCDWKSASTIAAGFQQDQKYTWRAAQMLYHYREMPGQGAPFRNSVDTFLYVRGPKSDGHRIVNTTHNWISKYWYYGKHENHPAEKDPEICAQMLDWCSDVGDTVFDPFMGSGTTGVACMQLGRNFIGCEIEPKYFEIAKKRIEQAAMQAIRDSATELAAALKEKP